MQSNEALPGTDRHVHQADGLDLRADDPHGAVARRQLHLLPQQPAFGDWSQSTPQRVVAWHGIQMVRDLNNAYMGSLHDVFPRVRRGPEDDVAKINCATCHQGVYKPLYGVSMVTTFPELKGPLPPYVRATPVAARAPDPAAGAPPIVSPATTALPPALQAQPTDRLPAYPAPTPPSSTTVPAPTDPAAPPAK